MRILNLIICCFSADMIDDESINRTINFVLEQLSELTQETEYNIFSQDSKLLNM